MFRYGAVCADYSLRNHYAYNNLIGTFSARQRRGADTAGRLGGSDGGRAEGGRGAAPRWV